MTRDGSLETCPTVWQHFLVDLCPSSWQAFTLADSDVDLLCGSVCFLTFELSGNGLLMRCPVVVARCTGLRGY